MPQEAGPSELSSNHANVVKVNKEQEELELQELVEQLPQRILNLAVMIVALFMPILIHLHYIIPEPDNRKRENLQNQNNRTLLQMIIIQLHVLHNTA